MSNYPTRIIHRLHHGLYEAGRTARRQWRQPWPYVLGTLALLILLVKDVSFQVSIGAPARQTDAALAAPQPDAPPDAQPMKMALGAAPARPKPKDYEAKAAYVARFADVAVAEMQRFGIPASITLGQGLLESNAGRSALATRNHNHFGIKCFSKTCQKGHCSNFDDDTHKDFFRIYASAWESYRAHSQLLASGPYAKLKALGTSDYKGWAKGLAKAGYATDPDYAEKLVRTIEEMGLHQYDQR